MANSTGKRRQNKPAPPSKEFPLFARRYVFSPPLHVWTSPEDYQQRLRELAAKHRADGQNAFTQIRRGIGQYRRGALIDAKKTFQRVVEKCPNTTAAKQAAAYARLGSVPSPAKTILVQA